MDIGELLSSANLFDLVAVLFLFGMFVLGFVQGAIRRLLGLASMLFAFLLAGQLRGPLGAYLAENWTQFPPQYSYMLAYGFVFAFTAILFSIIIQSFYKHQALFQQSQLADEIIGGLLGVVQGVVFIGIMIIILDTFYELPGIPIDPDELPFLRAIHDWYDPSATAAFYREVLIPAALAISGPLVPDEVKAFFPGGSSSAT